MDTKIPNSIIMKIDGKVVAFLLKFKDKSPFIPNIDSPLNLDIGDGYFSKLLPEDFCLSLIVPGEKEGTEEGQTSVSIKELAKLSIGANDEDDTMEDLGEMYKNRRKLFLSLIMQSLSAYISGDLTKEEKPPEETGEVCEEG